MTANKNQQHDDAAAGEHQIEEAKTGVPVTQSVPETAEERTGLFSACDWGHLYGGAGGDGASRPRVGGVRVDKTRLRF